MLSNNHASEVDLHTEPCTFFLVGSAILEYKLLPVICFYKVKLSYHTKTAITRLRKALSAIAVFVF